MKKLIKIALIISILIPSLGLAQNEDFAPKFNEFIQQKKLNKQYLYEYVITSVVKRIVQAKMHSQSKKSLGNINNDKNLNFLKDAGYIERLGVLPPILSESPYLVTTLSMGNTVIKYYQKTKKIIDANNEIISSDERNYYLNAFRNLLELVDQNVDELFIVIVDNSMNMSDSERLTRLKDLAEESTRKREFSQMLYTRTLTLLKERRNEINDVQLKSNFNNYEN